MKKNRVYFGLLILALVVTIVWTSAGMLGVNKEEKKYSVSVIVNDSNGGMVCIII
jgi:ribose transport system substrate-binding protein